MKKIIRMLLGVNVAAIGIVFLGGLGALLGVLNGIAGGYVSTWAVNRLISSDVGMLVGGLEGLLIGLLAGTVLFCVVFAILAFVGAILGGGSGSIPVFDASGDLLGWFGERPPDLSCVGCAFPVIGSLFVALVAGTVAGASLNSGKPLDPSAVGQIAALVAGGLGALGGLIVGIGTGVAVWGTEDSWPGVLAGLVDGGLLGYFMYHRWLEVVTLAVVGAIVGTLLFKLTRD